MNCTKFSWKEFLAQKDLFVGGRLYKQVCRASGGGNDSIYYGPIKEIALKGNSLTIHTEWRKKDSMSDGLPHGWWTETGNEPFAIDINSHQLEYMEKGVRIIIAGFDRFELYHKNNSDDPNKLPW